MMDIVLLCAMVMTVLISFIMAAKYVFMSRRMSGLEKQVLNLSASLDILSQFHQQLRIRFEQYDEEIKLISLNCEQIKNTHVEKGSYKQALKMLEMGASIDDVISTCQLSQAEVELMHTMSAYRLTKQLA